MFETRNRTPFHVGLMPWLDGEGREHAVTFVKATFDLGASRHDLPVAEQQVPIADADVHFGDPATSSVRYASDRSPAKPGTDVALVGRAVSHKAVKSMDVALAAGTLRKVVRIFGDRVWYRSGVGWSLSDPAPFTTMALVYERAFGGEDVVDDSTRGLEERNPVGTGYVMKPRAELDGTPAPNLEEPSQLIATIEDRPAPAGFGFIGRSWLPRRDYAGTYDEAWRDERCPLLPHDFDPRHFHAASAGLSTSEPMQGGEAVAVRGVTEEGELRFDLPKRDIFVVYRIMRERIVARAQLDTVLIEPDDNRVVLTYRSMVACPKKFLLLDYVRVSEEPP
jgi:hypothetical protein